MDWDKEGRRGMKTAMTLAEIQAVLMGELTNDEAAEFAGELIKWVELAPPME